MLSLITIDGSAGSGKGTLGRRLAEYLGFEFIDSGLLYRAVASLVLEFGCEPISAAQNLTVKDLERSDLRLEKVSNKTPDVAKIPEVREAINKSLRRMIDESRAGVVLDGRAGGREFPHAAVKVFLSASDEARAIRRIGQLRETGDQTTQLETVLADIRERDRKDKERATAPMEPAEDALVLPTDHLDADAVFEVVKVVVGHMLRH